MKNFLIGIFILFLLLSCVRMDPSMAETRPVDHGTWDKLLKENVDDYGNVNYKSFLSDSIRLSDYLNYLGNNIPNSQFWAEQDRLAYYLNLYNAATIQLVIRHYPLESIKEIGSKFQIPFVNTPWQIRFIRLGDQWYDLDNIEHGIIRKEFNEPRIHFALVCAAYSCPKLRNEAYDPERLHEQLDDQTRVFLANRDKNIIKKDELILSRIFQWYKGDFTGESQSKGVYR